MANDALMKELTVREILAFFGSILGAERKYYYLAMIYAVGIGLLSLALPVSVQMLVNTIANTGLTAPLVVLSITLFVLLLAAGLLNALRIHLMDMFGRRFYARMVSEIALRSVYALNPFFIDYKMGSLFNRYFDIVIVQKTVPDLMIGGFTIVLQITVGFALVSLYHPLFLGYTLVIAALIWLVWVIWGGRAIKSAVEVSHKKHATAAWLEGLGASNGFFKSERHIAEAMRRTDQVTGEYMDKHVKHFRNHFSQTVAFLLMYAAASAGLLGIGGWLVIQGELTLGQLVAAELVLSVAFFGLSQLGIYMAYFYELCAALEELSLFYDVEQEAPVSNPQPVTGDASIEFVSARGDARGLMATCDFSIPSGARVLGYAESHGIQREVTNFLKRLERPRSGYVTLGGQDIMGIAAHELRQKIIVLTRPSAIEMSIREYLMLSGDDVAAQDILEVLRIVDLDRAIAQLEDGLDTRIASTGWPLTITETMQLKLAAALIAKPRVLVLGALYDTMTGKSLLASLDELQARSETTIINFSARPRELGFSHYLYLGNEEQRVLESFESLCKYANYEPCAADQPLQNKAAMPLKSVE